jgi:hypothetical protein
MNILLEIINCTDFKKLMETIFTVSFFNYFSALKQKQ